MNKSLKNSSLNVARIATLAVSIACGMAGFSYAESFFEWFSSWRSGTEHQEDKGKVLEIRSLSGKRSNTQAILILTNGRKKRFTSFFSTNEIQRIDKTGEEIIFRHHLTSTGKSIIYSVIGADTRTIYYQKSPNSSPWLNLASIFVFAGYFALSIFCIVFTFGLWKPKSIKLGAKNGSN